MTSKLSYYDVIGVLVPGLFVLGTWIVTNPTTLAEFNKDVPKGLQTLVLTAIALVVGQALHCLGSVLEPLLNLSWGGRPSTRLLNGRPNNYLPSTAVERIKKKIRREINDPDATSRDLFLYAMTRAYSNSKSRAGLFNSLYAHHRNLFAASVVATILLASQSDPPTALIAAVVVIAIIFWWRARARGYYFAREVLLNADVEIK